jgi:hypothetical protein
MLLLPNDPPRVCCHAHLAHADSTALPKRITLLLGCMNLFGRA